jgi:hypothetical protein
VRRRLNRVVKRMARASGSEPANNWTASEDEEEIQLAAAG